MPPPPHWPLTAACSLQPELWDWLDVEDLWPSASPLEARFLRAPSASTQDQIAYTWGAEHVWVWAWVLQLTDDSLLPMAQASCGSVLEHMPAPGESTRGFLRQVSARSAEQVADAAEAMFHAHASCRRAQREGQAERHGYDLEVARERHRALNWSIGYGGASWDEVTTDT